MALADTSVVCSHPQARPIPEDTGKQGVPCHLP
jgi:hypothetical protein